jgi:glycosyltransferase involved in cell wall biosynthesis
MKIVAIATPSFDGKVTVEYASSLADTISYAKNLGIEVHNFFYSKEAIVQSARNKLLAMIDKNIYDCVVFIDSDISWKPEDLFKLVESKKDVVGGTYRKKQNEEDYVFNQIIESVDPYTFEVKSLGFGFVKISKKAIHNLMAISENYIDNGILCKNIFEVIVKDGQMYSEDVTVCNKLRDLGFKIYLDKKVKLIHTGTINFVGNFDEWSKSI